MDWVQSGQICWASLLLPQLPPLQNDLSIFTISSASSNLLIHSSSPHPNPPVSFNPYSDSKQNPINISNYPNRCIDLYFKQEAKEREGEEVPHNNNCGGANMITRSTLVEQLRDYQIRSENKRDVIGALSWGLLFCLLVIASYVILYFRYHRLSAVIIFIGILVPICVYIRQRKLAKKRERRLLLPLSM